MLTYRWHAEDGGHELGLVRVAGTDGTPFLFGGGPKRRPVEIQDFYIGATPANLGALAGDVGSEVELGRVLAVVNDSNELAVGAAVAEARVKGTISGHGRGDKVSVFKFKRKKQYKRTIGHRQNYTQVTVRESWE